MTGGCTRAVRLRAGVRLLTSASGTACLAGGDQRFPLVSDCAVPLVRALALRALTWWEIAHETEDTAESRALVVELEAQGWLETTVACASSPGYSLSAAPATSVTVPIATPPRLSDHAVITSRAGCLVVAHAGGGRAVRLHDPALAAFIATLCGETAHHDQHGEMEHTLLKDLEKCGLLAPATDARSALLPHELWFHTSSHLWYEPDSQVVPPARTPRRGDTVPLAVPDLAAVSHRDPRLIDVMETRRSVREHDDHHPMTADQLAELLYRVFRVRETRVAEGIELRDRPLPSGGSLHELEVYPVVRKVEGLVPGVYHYDSDEHRLAPLAAPGHETARLLTHAEEAGAMRSAPQVLLVLTARIDRLSWKYSGLSYALALKHVGVAQHALYLVGTAMGLAPCALGDGDRMAFAAASGTNPVNEPAVGEFLVGSRKEAGSASSG